MLSMLMYSRLSPGRLSPEISFLITLSASIAAVLPEPFCPYIPRISGADESLDIADGILKDPLSTFLKDDSLSSAILMMFFFT